MWYGDSTPGSFGGILSQYAAASSVVRSARAATRPRAKVLLLKEPSRRYLFITNTSVDGVLAQGRVSVPSQRSSPTFLPTNLKLSPEQKAQLSGRFGLIEQMTLTETRRQIDQLLTQHLRVPTQNLNACINRLKRLVEDRFLEVPDPLR